MNNEPIAHRRSGQPDASAAATFPLGGLAFGPATRARHGRLLLVALGLAAAAAIGAGASTDAASKALALGLAAPGGGFLLGAGPACPAQTLAVSLAVASACMLLAAGLVWFATGNVVLPAAVWAGAALAAAALAPQSPPCWPAAELGVPLAVAGAGLSAYALSAVLGLHALRRRAMLNASLRALAEPQAPRCGASGNSKPELSLDDLRLLRVLLDRALQPVSVFDGFEHIEQFQTSALRYQINFSSYALALAQATHLPALQGYMHLAQRNLAAKQLDHRIWRYWRLENLWGNLDPGADPVARDNIMLSGFLAAQLAFAGNATGRRDHDAPGSLAFRHPSGAVYAYSLPSIARLLGRAYARAPFGLLACEPNWVYPLCNAITAAAIRAQDTAGGSSVWNGIEASFRHRLETEFLSPVGRFIPCRSSLTGLALPPVGGAAMQALPCLFLNATLPDIARRHWLILR